MKTAAKIVPIFLALWISQILYAAYPKEYPVYLGLLGFRKSEIEGLRDGGTVTHSIYAKAPGEFGISAARVFNVPVYYFRDYYSYIENYKSLFHFESIGRFSAAPSLHDLRPLRFTDGELNDLLTCKAKACGLKLSAAEIETIPAKSELKTEAEREEVSDAYRRILLARLISYQQKGLSGLAPYEDGSNVYNPKQIGDEHLLKFDHLDAYFPGIVRYLNDYPQFKDSRIEEFFYWSRENLGNKPVISIRHVVTRRIGEDYIVVNRAIYCNHYYLSSVAVMHLINYADAISPWTLFVFEQRTLTDLHGPLEGIGRNILRTNLEKMVSAEFKAVGKEMEERYKSRSYRNFPFGLLPRDQE